MPEACCFHNFECVDLEFAACLTAGGLPMGPDTACGPPGSSNPNGIGDCANQACCWRQFPGDPLVCDDTPPNYCETQLPDGRPQGRGLLCRHIAEVGGCNLVSVPMPCCLVDGSRIETYPEYCGAIRGVPVLPGEPCPPPQTDEECRLPEPDREAGPIWTLELCATAVLVPRLAADLPAQRDGYGFLVTARGVRNTPEAACELAGTTLFLEAGYGEPVLCSRQSRNLGQTRGHEGAAVLEDRHEPAVTRPGYGLFVSAYDAPDWTEANVGSRLMRCWGPEE